MDDLLSCQTHLTVNVVRGWWTKRAKSCWHFHKTFDFFFSLHDHSCVISLPSSAPLPVFSFAVSSSLPFSPQKGFVLTDTQQDYHHSTQETTHLSLHPPPSIHLPIHPSIDCHYSWTSVIPLLVQLRFPFPSHHSALSVEEPLLYFWDLLFCHIWAIGLIWSNLF